MSVLCIILNFVFLFMYTITSMYALTYMKADVSETWIATCFAAYQSTGFMYEKYNAFVFGVGGGGGEYVPQVGFGWSNGVVLYLLDKLQQQ